MPCHILMLTISTILFESTSKKTLTSSFFYKDKVDPSREKIHDLSQKRGIRKPNEKNKNRHERTKPLSAQYKIFNEQEQP